MTTFRLLLLLFCSFCSIPLFSQLDFKLQLMPSGTKWGVYVQPQAGIVPSTNTITGSGQITLVAPLNFVVNGLTAVSGNWNSNAVINGPIENPSKTYVSFGLVADVPIITYSATAPTLLFTFNRAPNTCPDVLYLIDNDTDPFNVFPNSANNNPGNEITVLDFGANQPTVYNYGENIGLFAWDCHDCDADGIPNAHEDTNGDGQWTPGIDASDLCNGSGCVTISGAQLHCSSGGTACGNDPTGPLSLLVDILGGLPPFTVKYTDGNSISTLQNYQSGAPFPAPATHGANYELVEVTGADGCFATAEDLSGEVPVTLQGAVLFSTQPADVAICNGAAAQFSVCASATNATFSFSWQFSSDGGATWEPVPMGIIFNQTNTSTMTNGCDELQIGASFGLAGYRFRAVASGSNLAPVYSQPASLDFAGTLQVTGQPQGVAVCYGNSAVFTANITNNGAGSVSYQWQSSTNGGATWTNVLPTPNITGANTATLTIGTTVDLTSRLFRLQVQLGTCPPIFTQAATLTIAENVLIDDFHAPSSVCRGTEACFEVQAYLQSGGQPNYQWQERQNGATDWTDIPGATIAAWCLPNSEGKNGNCYRALVSTAGCEAETSQEACLVVEDVAIFEQQPEHIVKCAGETATLNAAATIAAGYEGVVNYRWQTSTDGGQNWQDLDNDSNHQGTNNSTLLIGDVTGLANHLYRLGATTGVCAATYSEAASITVEGPLGMEEQPQSLNICAGSEAVFSASVINPGSGGLLLQWQASDNGTDWTNLVEGGDYTGTQNTMLTVQNAVASRYFRLSASTTHCGTIYSAPATLSVEELVSFNTQPQDAMACTGETVVLTAGVESNSTSVLLQWQASDDGTNWTDLAEDGVHVGTQSNTLTVQAVFTGRQYRLNATSGICPSVFSNLATVAVETPISFSQQPESTTVCEEDAVSFTVAVGGGNGLSLQWQSSQDGQTWSAIAEGGIYAGTQTSTLTIAAAAGLDGMRYRLAAASQNCHSNSAVAVLSLEEASICHPEPEYKDCVSLSVKRGDDNIGWSVWVKVDNTFTETPYQLPTSGKITLVAPLGFAVQGLTSHSGGKWKPGKVYLNPSQDPGKVYFEFNLTPNQNFLELTPGGEQLLFSFSFVDGCPTAVTLMDNIVPPGFSPNQFTGFGAGLTETDIPFHFCGNLIQDGTGCPTTYNLQGPTDGSQVASGHQLDLQPGTVPDDFPSVNTAPALFFGVAPNPTRGELNVAFFETNLQQTATLRLWNLQGQLLFTERTDGTTHHRLNLSSVVPGSYFLTLDLDGKRVQREKIIVQ